MFARARTQVEQSVRGAHDLRIVLDDQQRIAGIAHPLHDRDHASHVARMQADRRLVEHEQGVDQRGAERGGEIDALDFAARERARLPIQRQITQTHLAQELEPHAQFAQHQGGGLIQGRGQSQRAQKIAAVRNRQADQLVHRRAALRRRPHPGATAERRA